MKNSTIKSAWLAAMVFISCVVSAQEFLPYEGKNAIQEGEGGTKKVVDGVDFWADGAPPRMQLSATIRLPGRVNLSAQSR